MKCDNCKRKEYEICEECGQPIFNHLKQYPWQQPQPWTLAPQPMCGGTSQRQSTAAGGLLENKLYSALNQLAADLDDDCNTGR